MTEPTPEASVKVFIGHEELWPALRRCVSWHPCRLDSGNLRCVRISDSETNWLLVQFALGATLDAEQVCLTLKGALPVGSNCIYFHKWTRGSGGGRGAFAAELAGRMNADVIGFSGRDPHPVHNRGFYLLSSCNLAEVMDAAGRVPTSAVVSVSHLPCLGEGADLVVIRIRELRELLASIDGHGRRDDLVLRGGALHVATSYFVGQNPVNDASALLRQSEQISHLVESLVDPTMLSRPAQMDDLLDNLERSIVFETDALSKK